MCIKIYECFVSSILILQPSYEKISTCSCIDMTHIGMDVKLNLIDEIDIFARLFHRYTCPHASNCT